MIDGNQSFKSLQSLQIAGKAKRCIAWLFT
jgi:hypothetical protein